MMKYKVSASIALFLSLIALLVFLDFNADSSLLSSGIQAGQQSDQSSVSEQSSSELQPDAVSSVPPSSISQPVIKSSAPAVKVTKPVTPVTTKVEAKEQPPTSSPQVSSSQTVVVPLENYGYSLLGESEKVIYNQLLSGLNSMTAEIAVTPTPIDTFQKIYCYVIDDNPQLFWVDNSGYTYYYYSGNVNKIIQPYLISAGEKSSMTAALEAKASNILSKINSSMGDFDKALVLHDTLVNSIVYDASAPLMHSLYGALVNGRAVCDGYSKAYQFLCSKAGIRALVIKGTATSGGTSGGHAWNMIYMESAYYHVDLTWDDPDSTTMPGFALYTYFGLTTQQISANHTIDQGKSFPAPTALATQCNYYIKEGLYFSTYDICKSNLEAEVREVNPSKEIYIQMKFSADAYNDAKKYILGDTSRTITAVNPSITNRIKDTVVYFFDGSFLIVLTLSYF